jgi:hypothetical protein
VNNSKDEEDFDLDWRKKRKLMMDLEGLSRIEAQKMLYSNFSNGTNNLSIILR